jgi:hypothetical protein
MSFKWPRKASIPHMIPAEIAIRDAVNVVEGLGADVLLTDAVILLDQARSKVAEWYDREHPETKEVVIGDRHEAT